jgi:hypothetical protein
MDAKKGLTGFAGSGGTGTGVAALLAEAGLELWQAPEGFWAIRVRPAPPPSAAPPRRRLPAMRRAR